MGYANAQRTLDYIRILTEFISQPQYRDVVVMFGILNEPSGSPSIGSTQLDGLYVLTSSDFVSERLICRCSATKPYMTSYVRSQDLARAKVP